MGRKAPRNLYAFSPHNNRYMDERSLIKIKDISKVYKMGRQELKVLDNVSLKIEKGEFVSILGPSGSGKSTLMNILGCIDTPTSGGYILDGRDIKSSSDDELATIRNQKIGFVFQRFNLLPKYTAIHNTEIPLILRGVARKEATIRAEKMLDLVGLSERKNHTPMELSGGQQQRVAIARALIGDPEIILADEPTGNLDSKSGQEIIDLFTKLNNEGNTIILITHDISIAQKTKRIIEVMDGRIIKSYYTKY